VTFAILHFVMTTVTTRTGRVLEFVQRREVASLTTMTAACGTLDMLGGVLVDEQGEALAEDLDPAHLERFKAWARWQERLYGRAMFARAQEVASWGRP
jgi:hypothetical protein